MPDSNRPWWNAQSSLVSHAESLIFCFLPLLSDFSILLAPKYHLLFLFIHFSNPSFIPDHLAYLIRWIILQRFQLVYYLTSQHFPPSKMDHIFMNEEYMFKWSVICILWELAHVRQVLLNGTDGAGWSLSIFYDRKKEEGDLLSTFHMPDNFLTCCLILSITLCFVLQVI